MNKQEALNKIAELQKYIEGIDKKKEYRPREELEQMLIDRKELLRQLQSSS